MHQPPAVEPPAVDEGFYVAIPSYQRPEDLRLKTLALLEQQGVPKQHVYIFVANAAEHQLYQEAVGKDWGNIVIGELGLWRQRNFITSWFKEAWELL